MEWAPLTAYFGTLMVKREVNGFYYKRYFFAIQTLLQKYVKLWQRQQMPKVFFDCRADTGFSFEH